MTGVLLVCLSGLIIAIIGIVENAKYGKIKK